MTHHTHSYADGKTIWTFQFYEQKKKKNCKSNKQKKEIKANERAKWKYVSR